MIDHETIVRALIAHASAVALAVKAGQDSGNQATVIKSLPELFAEPLRMAQAADRVNVEQEARR